MLIPTQSEELIETDKDYCWWIQDYFDTDDGDYDSKSLKYSAEDMDNAWRLGAGEGEVRSELNKRIGQLEDLLAANVRVLKAEIIKEQEEEKK